MRQLGAIVDSGNRTRDLARIKAPTLVIHGTKDKMIRASRRQGHRAGDPGRASSS